MRESPSMIPGIDRNVYLVPPETFFPQPFPIFLKCLLSAFMLRDRFFCLAPSEGFPLSSREAGIAAFLASHFRFAFGILLQPARNR